MKTCPIPRRLARTDDRDLLSMLATGLDPVFERDGYDVDAPAHLVAAIAGPPAVEGSDHVDLLVKPLTGHPAQDLMGFDAPAEWACLGVATAGWARSYDPGQPGLARATGEDRRRVRLLHLVGRDGASINVMREPGAEPTTFRTPPTGSTTPDTPDTSDTSDTSDSMVPVEHTGLVDDCLRRALGLPTAPPPGTTIELWALLWLDRILSSAALGLLEHASWAVLASLFPSFDLVERDGDPLLMDWALDHVVRSGEILARHQTWDRVRERSLCGEGPMALPLDVVEWMDLGMFARTLLGALPPLQDALLDLDVLLAGEAYVQLVDTVEAWGLLT